MKKEAEIKEDEKKGAIKKGLLITLGIVIVLIGGGAYVYNSLFHQDVSEADLNVDKGFFDYSDVNKQLEQINNNNSASDGVGQTANSSSNRAGNGTDSQLPNGATNGNSTDSQLANGVTNGNGSVSQNPNGTINDNDITIDGNGIANINQQQPNSGQLNNPLGNQQGSAESISNNGSGQWPQNGGKLVSPNNAEVAQAQSNFNTAIDAIVKGASPKEQEVFNKYYPVIVDLQNMAFYRLDTMIMSAKSEYYAKKEQADFSEKDLIAKYLSGVFYAKTPKNCGNIIFKDPSWVTKTMFPQYCGLS